MEQHPVQDRWRRAARHSLIEMRRYAVRFMHQLHLIHSLRGILRTKYDQYNSLIRPLEKYLADHGVHFVSGATVTDMDIRIEGSDERIVPVAEKDLAFMGQFVELEGDVVFTVETSVRTAMIAVYRLLHLERPITPLFQGQYDIRMVNVALKTLLGKDKIEVGDLPKVNPLKLPQTMHEIVNAINQIPPVPEYYSERKENQ